MAITEEWAANAWPWLLHQATSVGVAPPEGPPTEAILAMLPALAERGERLDSMANAYVLSYALSVFDDLATLQRHASALGRCAGYVDESCGEVGANQLASSVLASIERLREITELQRVIGSALLRCIATPLVLSAREVLIPVPPPPASAPLPPPVPAQTVTEPTSGERDEASSVYRLDTGPSHLPAQRPSWSPAQEWEQPATRPAELATAEPPDDDAPAPTEAELETPAPPSDPWSAFCVAHPVGSLIKGRVTSIQNYGAFVNVSPGLDGLVHISKLADSRVREVSDITQVGRVVTVKIIGFTPPAGVGQRGKISLSMRPSDIGESVGADVDASFGASVATTARDAKPSGTELGRSQTIFLEAARRMLVDPQGEPRPMLRDLSRAKGGWIVRTVKSLQVENAVDVVGALIESLAAQVFTRPMTRSQLDILTLATAATTNPGHVAQAEALRWVSNDGFVPDIVQVRQALAASRHSRPVIVELLGHALVRTASRAIQEQNSTTAALVLDVAVELGQDLTQARASELKDLLESIQLPSTARLKFDDLCDRADPANRPDLAALANLEQRATLLAAVPMVNADVAVEVARTCRDELLDQALMWLAQQLGNSIARWMPPRSTHPAVTVHEKQLADWRTRQRQSGMGRSVRRTEREEPVGLKQEVVDRAVRGDAAAARQAAQALDSMLRANDSVAEEWDAFLTATLDRSGDADAIWQRIKNPSPEVWWNRAVFEGNHRFSKHMAWRHLEHALTTPEANPQTLLHGLYHAVKTLTDSSAGPEAVAASAAFVAAWGPEVPEGRMLLAALSLMDAMTEEGYARAREAFSRWSRLADPPALVPMIPRRRLPEARQAIQNLRADTRYARRWVLLVLCDAAVSAADRGVGLACLTAGAEVAEQLSLTAIARGLYSRAVDDALKQMHRPRPGTEAGVRRTFVETCIGALTFGRKTEDLRLARQVRSAVTEAGGEPNPKINDLLTEMLGLPDNRVIDPPVTKLPKSTGVAAGSGLTTVPPALAQLAPSFSEVRTPADVVRLRHRLLSALNIVKADDETIRAVSDLMAQLDRLAGGVGIGEVRDLLTEIGQLCERLDRERGRSGDHSLAAMLKAVDVARRYAAGQVEDAPTPTVRVADGWYGVARESDRPHVVLTVTGPAEADITNVTVDAGGPRVHVGRLRAGEESTIWAVAGTEPGERPGTVQARLTVTWTWGMVADRSVTLSLVAPLASWGSLLAEAGELPRCSRTPDYWEFQATAGLP